MTEFSNINQQFSNIPRIIFTVIAGLVLPLLLIPLVKFTGYSEVVEEVAKALVVLFLILALVSSKQKFLVGILFGFLFGLSESVLYLNNIFQIGDFSVFWQRIFWTVPMHIITVLVILFSGLKSRKLVLVGLALAIIIHLVFNDLVNGSI